MIRCSLKPYEGKEKYIFVSYAHRDNARVYPIIEALAGMGYRIWYDEGIDPGSEWPETIAEHLGGCEVCLGFLSQNYLKSQNCRREVNFALSKKKFFITVVLEPVEMSPGMEMQLSTTQFVSKYTFRDEKAFYEKLCAAKYLSACRKETPQPERPAGADPAEGEDAEPWPPEEAAGGTGGTRAVLGGGAHFPQPKLIIAGVCAAAILIVVIIAAVLHGGGGPGQASDPGGVQSSDATAQPSQEPVVSDEPAVSGEPGEDQQPAAMYHATLTVGSQVTVREFNEALPILTQRLEVLTGGEPYEMTVGDDFVDLYLPKGLFGTASFELALKCYVTRAMDLYIFNRLTPSYLSMQKAALSREDLESVVLTEGAIEGIDPAQYGIDTPTYQYIAVTLTDECAQRYSGEIAEWGENLTFAQDIDRSPTNYFYHDTIPAGDGKTFYILNTDLGGHFNELMVYNFTHAPLPYSFGVMVDLDNSVEWQKPEETPAAGENQCDASQLTGDTVTILYQHYTKELTPGELLDLETEMKTRLDILEQPYAYGHVEDETYFILAVKTGLEHMGTPVINLLASTGSPYLRADLVGASVGCEAFAWEEKADGTYCVTLELRPYYAGNLTMLSGSLAEQGDGTLALAYSSQAFPVLSTGIDRQIEDGIVTFDHICFTDGGAGSNITREELWFLRLLEQVWLHSKSTTTLSAADVQMNLDGRVATPDESKYGVSYARKAQDMTNAILSAAPDADVIVDDTTVYVTLDLQVNEDLPEAATAAAREIYEASGFAASDYRQMTIYLVKENDAAAERARIFFWKIYTSLWPSDQSLPEGLIYVRGIFMNGRLERYKEAFKNIVETDPFYTGLTVEGSTIWSF